MFLSAYDHVCAYDKHCYWLIYFSLLRAYASYRASSDLAYGESVVIVIVVIVLLAQCEMLAHVILTGASALCV